MSNRMNLRLRTNAASESNWLGRLLGSSPSKSDEKKEMSSQLSEAPAPQAIVMEAEPETYELEEDASPLTGSELRELCYEKYGHCYDMAIVKRVIMGKKLVFLNILWLYLGQRSFSLSEEEYMDKLGTIAEFVNAAGEQGKVRKEMQGPLKGKNGMPRRPVVGTAISLSLNVPEQVLESWGM